MRTVARLWAFALDNSLLLVAGTIGALLWANIDELSYTHFAELLHFPVNDIGMVFFFALAMKEIVEATLAGGPLASPREAAVPLLAAVGGMAVPAAMYATLVTITQQGALMAGWAVPCATDIAFSYMAAKLIFPKDHPAIPFLLLLAVADDAIGLLLIALFYPTGPLSVLTLIALFTAAIVAVLVMRRRRVRSFWAYTVVGGGLSWAALYLGGVHPALAMVPILPFMPHAKRDLGLFVPAGHASPDTMNQFEHWWRVPVQIILLLFGFSNAGVSFSSFGPGTWIVLSSLIIGKPVGIFLMTAGAAFLGLRLPRGLRLIHVGILGLAAGIGFTVALFFATAAFPPGEVLAHAKMGALLSFAAMPLAAIWARAVGLSPRTRPPNGEA